MHNDPIYMLKAVFDWLDGLIRDQGDYLYMLLVYVSIPLVAWILSGGLRRRLPLQTNITAIILIRPTTPRPPLPPMLTAIISHLGMMMLNRLTREPTDYCR
jgi:hypothetical protein